MKLKGKNPQDIKKFDALVNLMSKNENVQSIDVPKGVFSESFKTFMKEYMNMTISFTEVLANCAYFIYGNKCYNLIICVNFDIYMCVYVCKKYSFLTNEYGI